MPSFVCDVCQETLKKARLDDHFRRCPRASFSCIDCYKSFKGDEYKAHISCITEVQKYEKKGMANKTNVETKNGNKDTQTKKRKESSPDDVTIPKNENEEVLKSSKKSKKHKHKSHKHETKEDVQKDTKSKKSTDSQK